MIKRYSYPPLEIIFPNSLILLMPITLLYLWYFKNMPGHDILSSAVCWSFSSLIGVPVIIWIANNLSVLITVDEQGISKKSFLGSIQIKWEEVESVTWRILNENRDAQKPSDITIRTRDGKKMDVFSIVQQVESGNGGISELEEYIQTRVPSIRGCKQQQQSKELQRQLRSAVVGGILALLFGVIVFQKPLNPNQEKLGFISKRIGMSADALVLMMCGVGLIGFGIYKLKKPRVRC